MMDRKIARKSNGKSDRKSVRTQKVRQKETGRQKESQKDKTKAHHKYWLKGRQKNLKVIVSDWNFFNAMTFLEFLSTVERILNWIRPELKPYLPPKRKDFLAIVEQPFKS